ncbi:unnamed protein product, partial [Strongylus vulgaris]
MKLNVFIYHNFVMELWIALIIRMSIINARNMTSKMRLVTFDNLLNASSWVITPPTTCDTTATHMLRVRTRHNITCHYGVGLTYDGPVCYCPTDQISQGDSCVAEDKCGRRFKGHPPICSQMCQNLPNGITECDCYEDFRPNGSYCNPRETIGSFVAVLGNMFVMTSTIQWESFPTKFQRTINQNRRMIAAAADTKRNWICYVMAAVKADPLTYAFMECSSIAKKASKIVETDITASFPLDDVRTIYHDPIGDNWLFLIGRTRLLI